MENYIIKLNNKLDLEATLTSGQCFRAFKEIDNSFTIILIDRVVNVSKIDNKLIIKSNNYNNIEEVINNYFDLDRDYETINKEIIKSNNDLNEVIKFSNGYKILKQDPLETIISYLISQNNNVKRIENSINLLCKTFGNEVLFNNKSYYLFPTIDKLSTLKLEDLSSLGLGYRDKYIISFIEALKKDINYIETIKSLNSKDALDKLMEIKGIGLKVASCILLFGFNRLDVYPIDTWVKKYISDKYNITGDLNKIKKELEQKFPNYTGLIIQYIYHYNRNNKDL